MTLIALYILVLAAAAALGFRAWQRHTKAGRRLEQLRRLHLS